MKTITKAQYKLLMESLYYSHQLFIPKDTTIDEWIETTFENIIKLHS
jgi:hypothetical protein